jgi:hypothetical protein
VKSHTEIEAPRLSPTQLTGGFVVAIVGPGAGSWIGAHIGNAGTVLGAGIGSVVSAVLLWLFLRVLYHTRKGLSRIPWRQAKRWQVLAGGGVAAGLLFALSLAGVSAVEAGVLHKPLAASVTHTSGSGTTLGLTSPRPYSPAPSATEPSSSPSAAPSPVTVSPSVVPAVGATGTTAVPSLTPAPMGESGVPVTATDATTEPTEGATP